MRQVVELQFGGDRWSVSVDESKLVPLDYRSPKSELRSAIEHTTAALRKPYEYEPLNAALTPDDLVCIVVETGVPHLGEIVGTLLEELVAKSINPEQIRIVANEQTSLDALKASLSEQFAAVDYHCHDPAIPKELSYVATTKGERRVYLNSRIADADAVIVVCQPRLGPDMNYRGAESVVYPWFSDTETIENWWTTDEETPESRDTRRKERLEVLWQFGTPYFLQVIAGPNDSIAEIVGGILTSLSHTKSRFEHHWTASVRESADLVIAAIPTTIADFGTVATGALLATRALATDGRLVILSPALQFTGEAIGLLRGSGEPDRAVRRIGKRKPPHADAARAWARTAMQSRLTVAGWETDLAEELFATEIQSIQQLQRLIDAAERVVVLPDAHLTLLEPS